jgi:hypothetical protein
MTPWIGRVRDWRDDRRARRLRGDFGRTHRLVSWRADGPGRWLARVSCPGWPEPVERAGASRLEAIGRADRALRRASRYGNAHTP